MAELRSQRSERGALYGTTYLGGSTGCFYHNGCGTVFSITTDGTEKVLHRFGSRHYDYDGGSDPETSLIDVNGTLYGTTADGGSFGDYGTIYSTSKTGSVKFLHDFRGADGSLPQGDLINVNGTLYGTTFYGGRRGKGTCCGTVFALTL